MASVAVPLPHDPETLKALLIAERLRAERLEEIIKAMQRHCFARRAETLPEDQLLLGLEDVEQAPRRTRLRRSTKPGGTRRGLGQAAS